MLKFSVVHALKIIGLENIFLNYFLRIPTHMCTTFSIII
jgi:hypothetical protein